MSLTPTSPQPAPAVPPGAPGPHTPPDAVHCTIDGFDVAVPKGTLIIRAAEMVGIQIPRFCDHPLLEPVGACRQCLVEVEGQRKPAASCTMPVTDGMVVKTQLSSPVADKAQQGTMELLLINHPLDCPVCDKGGECPLQNQAMSNGRAESRFVDEKRTYPKPLPISSEILLDRERCVLCARCTRFSQQIAGDPFIELFERGALEQVAIYEDEPFSSYFSGNTTQICPVGALTSAQYRFRARPFDLRSEPSVCEHCASGCAMRTDYRRGKVTRRLAGDDPAVNEEWTCDKGRYAFRYATANERLMTPMVRRDGVLEPASWPEAWAVAADGLRRARAEGGVGVLPGGRLTVEDAYAWATFARVALGTNDVDARARAHSPEELAFLAAVVAGTGPATGAVTYEDLGSAPAVLLAGLEPEEESPILFLRLRRAVRTGGLAVFDLAPFATRAAEKLQATVLTTLPGAEARSLHALAEGSWGGPAVDALRQPGAVLLAGERLAEAPGALTALLALARATGARVAWVPRRAGERGAVEVGALPTLLPGGRAVDDPAARAEVAAVWGVDPDAVPAAPGRDLTGILAAARAGRLPGLLVGGVDPADLPDPALALAALDAASFVVSLEMFPTEVTERADVVLPVAAAPEKAGSYLDWEGRRRSFDATLHGTGQLGDGRVLHGLADAMGVDLRLPAPEVARAALASLGVRRSAAGGELPDVAAPGAPALREDEAVLASWRQLLDVGTLQRDEPELAGTARPPVARVGAGTAARLGLTDGDRLTVSGATGSISLPVAVTEMPDQVVWLPMRSPGSEVRTTLGTGPGGVVRLSAAPVPAGATTHPLGDAR
ncbi:NADH-quinone oxidoreductase subunit G [Blastococcus sp. MG754426]|uniref:NADH-quinone oxidoreductase subunit G n=1 Tax=unclassified Blastococcus TaxID=2619396 RepID=UPI001EF0624E|nr:MULTISPECIES: NADH-quinone oxidoreductase subunit G [unclassified Blastococcus]MCF6507720.1 NADH-quinone oxidoreductase subunit G [Blastococcus sp. MG754426]MCF6512266.1 NADH-quinone oxidoreductase subunit G [Blastococcus sp. MG754427]MCF6735292.1 NADH-quinone oxidoreductase subunit G [Blastococcus sp. KM273129]